jgi:hypothetical protein
MVVTALVLVLLAALAVEELGRRWLERMELARATAPDNPATATPGGEGEEVPVAVGGPSGAADAGEGGARGDAESEAGGADEPQADAGEAAGHEQEQPDWLRQAVAALPAAESQAAVRRPAPRRAAEALAGRWPRLWSLLAWWDRSSLTTPERVAAAALVLLTLLMLADYRVSDNRLQPDLAHNKVVTAMRKAGDDAGPVLGIPALKPTVTWNSATTYLAAQSRRRTLNAYNQTPARWLEDRMDRLEGLNRGLVDPDALTILRVTGTRQVLVVDEPRVFAPGQWREVINRLVVSGAFRLVVEDGPLALLEVTGAQRPSAGGNRPNSGFDPVTQV